jgi:hypothetical protein
MLRMLHRVQRVNHIHILVFLKTILSSRVVQKHAPPDPVLPNTPSLFICYFIYTRFFPEGLVFSAGKFKQY